MNPMRAMRYSSTHRTMKAIRQAHILATQSVTNARIPPVLVAVHHKLGVHDGGRVAASRPRHRLHVGSTRPYLQLQRGGQREAGIRVGAVGGVVDRRPGLLLAAGR